MKKENYISPFFEVEETYLEDVLLSDSFGETGEPGDLIDELDPILF